jgi:hypothetical protein
MTVGGNTNNATLVGAGLLAMDSSTPHFFLLTRVIVDDHRWQASSHKDRANPGNPDDAIPVGAGLPAMDSNAPRLSSSYALSLTTIAGKPAPTRDHVHAAVHAQP